MIFIYNKSYLKRILLIFLFLIFLTTSYSETYFITPTGNDLDTGTTWTTAFRTITKALNTSQSGDEIWVAEGVYKEGYEFEIFEGISLYGGFSGVENSIEKRKILQHPTIIDGQNTHRCLVNDGLIDGFHVRNGKREDWSGGGIWNDGTVKNCILYGNYAHTTGGGIFNYEGSVINCVLFNNSSNYDGGGICNYSGIVKHCTVVGNTADLGDGIINSIGFVYNSIIWYNGTVTRNCDIFGDVRNVYFTDYSQSINQNGNIRENPVFANTTGPLSSWNFHLQNGSPCIDAGSLDYTYETDIEGNPRPGEDGKVCMGAFESPDFYEPGIPDPPLRFYVKKSGSNKDGSSWEDAFTSVTKAIDQATSITLYDIWIAQGTYSEKGTIWVRGRTNLYGGFSGTENFFDERDWKANPSIINGEDSYRCIVSFGTIDGFHITHGNCGIASKGIVSSCNIYGNRSYWGYGAVLNSYGIIKDCNIFNNTSSYYSSGEGGGIYNDEGFVINCNIYSNQCEAYYTLGGGIYNYEGEVIGCRIYDNTAGDNGGGIYNNNGTISGCRIHDNTAGNNGGGICIDYGTISGCTIYSNYSGYDGGGIYNYDGILKGCTIFNNTAVHHGGGLYNSCFDVMNCLVYNNTADLGGGIYVECGFLSNCTVYSNSKGGIVPFGYFECVNCIIWKNEDFDIYTMISQASFSCFGEAVDENGNISANPLFLNTDGDISTWDFHLQNGSPCIDSGTTDTAQLPDKDLDGNPRPGTDNKVCMGVYESPDFYIPSDPLPSQRLFVSKTGSNKDGSSWEDAFTSITVAISGISGDDLWEIWVKEGIYDESQTFVIPVRLKLIGGFAGTEQHLEDRILNQHPTIITGDGKKNSIINYGIIDGFGITQMGENADDTALSNYNIARFCEIFNNKGSGVDNNKESGIIKYCLVYANEKNGINNYYRVESCTVYGNSIYGIYNIYSRKVLNTISWGNSSKDIYDLNLWGNEYSNIHFSCYRESLGINQNINQNPLFMNVGGNMSGWDFHLQEGSPCIDAGNPSVEYYDGCLPPGKGGLRCDMGVYGGPLNCLWGLYVGKQDLIDFLLGKRGFSAEYFPYADKNSDQLIDISDVISLVTGLQ